MAALLKEIYNEPFFAEFTTAKKKIFKITETVFYPGIPVVFNRKHSFKDLSTRKHYAGEHMLSIVINGKEHGVAQVQLL